MPLALKFLLRYFWLLGVVTAVANGIVYWFRAKKKIQDHPELAERYYSLIRRFVIYLCIPWIVMGIGMEIGGVATVFHFFRPRDGNPYVLAFHATVVVLWLYTIVWIYFRKGAEVIAEHSDIFNRSRMPATPLGVKLFAALCLLGGIIAMAVMWFGDMPAPDLTLTP